MSDDKTIRGVAQLLAEEHMKDDPDLIAVYWAPHPTEVRLVEVTEMFSANGEVLPFRFAADPPDVPFVSVCVQLAVADWEHRAELVWPPGYEDLQLLAERSSVAKSGPTCGCAEPNGDAAKPSTQRDADPQDASAVPNRSALAIQAEWLAKVLEAYPDAEYRHLLRLSPRLESVFSAHAVPDGLTVGAAQDNVTGAQFVAFLPVARVEDSNGSERPVAGPASVPVDVVQALRVFRIEQPAAFESLLAIVLRMGEALVAHHPAFGVWVQTKDEP